MTDDDTNDSRRLRVLPGGSTEAVAARTRETALAELVERLSALEAQGESAAFAFGDELVRAFPVVTRGHSTGWSEAAQRIAARVGVSTGTVNERRLVAGVFGPAERAALADSAPGLVLRWGVWSRLARMSQDNREATLAAVGFGRMPRGVAGVVRVADLDEWRLTEAASEIARAVAGTLLGGEAPGTEAGVAEVVEAIRGDSTDAAGQSLARAVRRLGDALRDAQAVVDGFPVSGRVSAAESLDYVEQAVRLRAASLRFADTLAATVTDSLRTSGEALAARDQDARVTARPVAPVVGLDEAGAGGAADESEAAGALADRLLRYDELDQVPRTSREERAAAAAAEEPVVLRTADGETTVRRGDEVYVVRSEDGWAVAYKVTADGGTEPLPAYRTRLGVTGAAAVEWSNAGRWDGLVF